MLDLQVVPAAQEMTYLPIVVDPSHATLETLDKINVISFSCTGADGIMLEVHPDPENSAVDPLQPIDFKSFKKLMKQLASIAPIVDRTI